MPAACAALSAARVSSRVGPVSTDASRPPGLLNGVAGLTPTSGGGLSALLGDLAKLAGAYSDAKVNGENLVLVLNPRQAITLRGLLVGPLFAQYSVVGSPAVAAAQVIAVAPDALGLYVSLPQIEASQDALV